MLRASMSGTCRTNSRVVSSKAKVTQAAGFRHQQMTAHQKHDFVPTLGIPALNVRKCAQRLPRPSRHEGRRTTACRCHGSDRPNTMFPAWRSRRRSGDIRESGHRPSGFPGCGQRATSALLPCIRGRHRRESRSSAGRTPGSARPAPPSAPADPTHRLRPAPPSAGGSERGPRRQGSAGSG